MYRLCILVCLLVISFSACKEQTKVALKPANEFLSADSIEQFKYAVIRYAGKLPGKADHNTKFDTIFDNHYINLAKQHDLVYYFPDNNSNSVKFMMTRIAPSLYEKKVAFAGKVVFDSYNKVVFYEEVFRTWRLLLPELKEKADLLFGLYLEGKDLTPYYTTNSKGVEYIEFPNEHVRFDTLQKLWISDLEDPLEPYYDMKR